MAEKKETEAEAEFLLVVGGAAALMIFAAVFGFAPGMLVLSILQLVFEIGLDKGQMWTFSIIASFTIFGGIWLFVKEIELSSFIYGGVSLTTIVLCAILFFGFKVESIALSLQLFFG